MARSNRIFRIAGGTVRNFSEAANGGIFQTKAVRETRTILGFKHYNRISTAATGATSPAAARNL